MNIPGVGSNCEIIVEEVDGVKDVRVNVEAEAGVTGFMVEKALGGSWILAAGGCLSHRWAAQDGGEGAEGVL